MDLFQKIADHTNPECAQCLAPHSCCDLMWCLQAERNAEAEGVTLEKPGTPELPYLGPEGCVVPPYLRPICSIHTCDVASLGFKKGDIPWTNRYFFLRDAAGEAMYDYQEAPGKR